MSVGVCVINRNGIALAADSAGTFTGNKMFYNSMNKVFSLSKKNICGAITYGTTVVYNVSIEQILKEFSVYLDSQKEIEDFFEILPLFEKFIQDNNLYYKFDAAENLYCSGIIKSRVVLWGNKIKAVINDEDATKKIDDILEELNREIQPSEMVENFDVSSYISIKYKKQYEFFVNMVVPELKNFIPQKERLWTYLSFWLNLPLKNETDNILGLFFAGYGTKDAFPKYVHIELLKVISGKMKYNLIEKYAESESNSKICPLAQKDVILTFCRGISGTFINYIPQKTTSLINEKIDSLPATYSDKQKDELKKIFGSCEREMVKSISSLIQKENVDPLFNSVQLIPLSEMAFLAENLVNITSLRRMFAIDGFQQTVGGPTDVAVISKGDGFVWVKSKTL